MKPAIEIRNLGKEYKLRASQPYVALRDVMASAVKNMLRADKKKVAKFKALEDINVDIMPGERVGIIGRNGAGKSTLLKIISRITPPTTGHAIIRGRVGSLLEVGTGFHPELTGRENIYLNGSILGLKRAEITKQLNTIIDFSGIGNFIDTALKHYSNGMQLRLAFSVAAHLEPEILLIDEVLAVGDAEFQKKCIGKMQEVSQQAGRVILFVSHNLKAINDICQKCILLENGKIRLIDNSIAVTNEYIKTMDSGTHTIERPLNDTKNIYLSKITVIGTKKISKAIFSRNEEIGISITIANNNWQGPFAIGLGLNAGAKGRVLISHKQNVVLQSKMSAEYIVWLPADCLTPNIYTVDISLLDGNTETLDLVTDALVFEIALANTKFEGLGYDYGVISKELNWENV